MGSSIYIIVVITQLYVEVVGNWRLWVPHMTTTLGISPNQAVVITTV